MNRREPPRLSARSNLAPSLLEYQWLKGFEFMLIKKCTYCFKELPLSMFTKNGHYDNGKQKYTYRCRICFFNKELKSKRNGYKKEYYKRFPEKLKAKQVLRDSLRRGKINKPNKCQDCKKIFNIRKIHAHHNDYLKPLDIVWICVSCHLKRHYPEFII